MGIGHLYIVRHGQTDHNQSGILQGQAHTDLNEAGRRQACLLGRFFAAIPLTEVWSSDIPRALNTARRIAAPHDLEVQVNPGLRERDVGPFEGRRASDVMNEFGPADPSLGDVLSWHRVKGVEQDSAIIQRVMPILDRAAGTPGTKALVTHGGVQNVLLRHILGIPETGPRGFLLSNGVTIAIVQTETGWKMEGFIGLEVMARLLQG